MADTVTENRLKKFVRRKSPQEDETINEMNENVADELGVMTPMPPEIAIMIPLIDNDPVDFIEN